MKKISYFLALFFCYFLTLSANEKAEKVETEKEPIQEEIVEQELSVEIEGKIIKYKVTTGQILLKSDAGANKATLFYIAYTKENTEKAIERPITFCFNGGPGSSSVWLHLGFLGPKKIVTEGIGIPSKPFRLEENTESLLDLTDLVFIDPVSTGYSRAVPGEDEKQFHGVEEDIKSVSEFIRLYTTRQSRWLSPKYLISESYGGIRACGVADYLYDNNSMLLNGLIFIAPVINLQMIDFSEGNDLAYVTALPTYIATSLYHNKLSKNQIGNRSSFLQEGSHFAFNEYLIALFRGNALSPSEKSEYAMKISQWIGLPSEEIEKANLRVSPYFFEKKLLSHKNELLGRFDGRFKGYDLDLFSKYCRYDPSLDSIMGPFTAVFNQYVRDDLQWKKDLEYKVLTNVFPWKWGEASRKCLNMASSLREVMIKNPSMKIFIATGIYDLAIPFSATQYTIDHLELPGSVKENITTKTYDAGHMIYLDQKTFMQLRKDVAEFILNN